MLEALVFGVSLLCVYTYIRHWGSGRSSLKQNIQAGLFCLNVLLVIFSLQGVVGTLRQNVIKRDLQIVLQQELPPFVVAYKYAGLQSCKWTRHLPFYYEREEVTLLFAELDKLEKQEGAN